MGWEGRLEHIFIAERASVEMEELHRADLIAGVGLDGDRYATGRGKYSPEPHPDRQVTLIEAETLEALWRDHRMELRPEETRRNLTVRNVPLNHLVGQHFIVGDVLLYGGRLNTPCKYLDGLLGKELFSLLLNRSGLNCRVIRGGAIVPGAPIRAVD
jgi:MOSC domain-containing protein YiiM